MCQESDNECDQKTLNLYISSATENILQHKQCTHSRARMHTLSLCLSVSVSVSLSLSSFFVCFVFLLLCFIIYLALFFLSLFIFYSFCCCCCFTSQSLFFSSDPNFTSLVPVLLRQLQLNLPAHKLNNIILIS